MRALLDRAESLFLARHFDAALECSLHVLQQLMGYEQSCSDSTELVATASPATSNMVMDKLD